MIVIFSIIFASQSHSPPTISFKTPESCWMRRPAIWTIPLTSSNLRLDFARVYALFPPEWDRDINLPFWANPRMIFPNLITLTFWPSFPLVYQARPSIQPKHLPLLLLQLLHSTYGANRWPEKTGSLTETVGTTLANREKPSPIPR